MVKQSCFHLQPCLFSHGNIFEIAASISSRSSSDMHNLKDLKDRRRNLRNFATSAEIHLWKYLRGKQLQGRKFRRQHSVGRYILDFYCPSERLAIELDGIHHLEPVIRRYDDARTGFLMDQGIRVLRFPNLVVLEQTEFVIVMITRQFDLPPPAPSYMEGRYLL